MWGPVALCDTCCYASQVSGVYRRQYAPRGFLERTLILLSALLEAALAGTTPAIQSEHMPCSLLLCPHHVHVQQFEADSACCYQAGHEPSHLTAQLDCLLVCNSSSGQAQSTTSESRSC